MKISYRQSGGFAGLVKEAELSTADLDPAEQQVVQNALQQLPADGKQQSLASQARDAMLHQIRIEGEAGAQEILVDDMSATPDVRALIGVLKKHARRGPGQGHAQTP